VKNPCGMKRTLFYDVLHLPNGERTPMKVRSMVGLIPLFAVQTLEPELLERLPNFNAGSSGLSRTGAT